MGHIQSKCPKLFDKPLMDDTAVKYYYCEHTGQVRIPCPKRGPAAVLSLAEPVILICAWHRPTQKVTSFELPLMYVLITVFFNWTRRAAVVDTGCTTSLIDRSMVQRLEITMQSLGYKMLSIDPSAPEIYGRVSINA